MIAVNPSSKRKVTRYIGRELDTKKFRTEEGDYDHEAYLADKKKKENKKEEMGKRELADQAEQEKE